LLLSAASVVASPVLAAPARQVTSELPRTARPLHYAIRVTPDAARLSFTGSVRIDVEVLKSTRSLTVNAAELVFNSVKLAGSGEAAKVSLDPKAQTATFTFAAPLKPGKIGLEIDYSGRIYQQATGLFALDYKDPKGAEKRALFTQFEAPDARRFVPSWDEPNFRTSFDLTAIVPADQMAVGNMPVAARKEVGNGLAEVSFQRTPLMPTYLLFFGLGEFERITQKVGDTEVGIIMGRGNAEKARYALDASAKLVPFYNDYFGVNYPLPKLDNVAGPGQSQFFGAMENWGAIFTFERVLLLDPKITSSRGKQRIFSIAGHEIAHQWFGDLVTMGWWDDLWLNEGFASWIESKATAHFNPDWAVEMDLVANRERAMGLDAYATTHPVIQTITSAQDVGQSFDAITYQKGEAVITMLEGFAGESVWRDGIRRYMKRHAYGNSRTDDLWAAVEEAGAKGLIAVAHDFTKKPGIPLIKVGAGACANGQTRLTLTQGQFSRDQKAKMDRAPLRWSVPVNALTLGQAPVQTIVTGGRANVSLPGCGPVVVNAGQSGYYRTLYSADANQQLVTNFGKLAPIDQLGLINDAVQLSHGDYQAMDAALDLLAAVPADGHAKLVSDALAIWKDYHFRFRDDAAVRKQIATRTSRLFGARLSQLGFAPKAGEAAPVANLRDDLIATLGRMGDAKVLAEARRLFARLDSDASALDGPLRETWLEIIAANASQADWDRLRQLGRKAESQVIKSSYYELLGGARDLALARQALALALTDEPSKTVSASMLNMIAQNFPDEAFDFAVANQKSVEALVDVSAQSRFIAQLARASSDPAMLAKLDRFAQTGTGPSVRESVEKAKGTIRTRLASEPRIKAGIREWLGHHGAN
jgi:aminopeptidase N